MTMTVEELIATLQRVKDKKQLISVWDPYADQASANVTVCLADLNLLSAPQQDTVHIGTWQYGEAI